MSGSFKSAIKYLLLLSIGLVILYWVFKDQNIQQILAEVKQANIWWMLLSSLALWLAHLIRALRWRMLFNSLNHPVSTSHAYHGVMIGYLVNLLLPRAGELARCSLIQKKNNIPILTSIGTVIVERVFDVVVLFLGCLGMLAFQHQLVINFLIENLYNPIIKQHEDSRLIWLLLIVIILMFWLAKKLIPILGPGFQKLFLSLKEGLLSFKHLKNKILFALYSGAIWFLYYLSLYLAFFALTHTQHLGMDAAFTAIVFSSLAMLAPIQGGIGVYHWMVAQALMLYGISYTEGLSFATIIHSLQLILTIILGSFSLIWAFFLKTANKI